MSRETFIGIEKKINGIWKYDRKYSSDNSSGVWGMAEALLHLQSEWIAGMQKTSQISHMSRGLQKRFRDSDMNDNFAGMDYAALETVDWEQALPRNPVNKVLPLGYRIQKDGTPVYDDANYSENGIRPKFLVNGEFGHEIIDTKQHLSMLESVRRREWAGKQLRNGYGEGQISGQTLEFIDGDRRYSTSPLRLSSTLDLETIKIFYRMEELAGMHGKNNVRMVGWIAQY